MKAIQTLLVLAVMLGTSLLASATCDPYYTYDIEDGTWVFDNLTECEGGIYCWYVDGVLQVIDPEFSWTPAEPGDYEICLNITYEGCSNWYCEDLEVSEEDCSPCHLTVNSHDCGDCIFLFSTEYDFEGDITWLLSDGTTASGDVLLHTFDGPGTYTVCAMSTTDLCGSISECFSVTTDCEGGEPLCEGGDIQVNPYGDCVWEITATDLPEGAELSWTIGGWWWGNSLANYYTAFGEETLDIELLITTPTCPDGYTLETFFVTEGCDACNEPVWLGYEYIENCSAGLYVWHEQLYAQEWTVNGEFYSAENYIEIVNNTGEVQVYEITVWPFVEGCPWAEPLTEYLTLEPCAVDCGPFDLFFTQDGCTGYFEIPGVPEDVEVFWGVNEATYTTLGGSLQADLSDVPDFMTAAASFTLPGCDETFLLETFEVISPCEDPCDQFYEIAVEFDPASCTAVLTIPGLVPDGPVQWWLGDVLFTSESNAISIDVNDFGTTYINAIYTPEGCPWLTEAILTYDFTCEVDCEIWAGYEACDTDVWFFGYGTGLVDWYIDGVYAGSGEQFDWQAPGPGVYEVCACLEDATCGGTCECFPLEIEDCPAPDYEWWHEGEQIFIDASGDLENLQWTFYGNDVYETYTGAQPTVFDISGPGDYTLCVWNLDCPNDCGDCQVITVADEVEEDCIPFLVEVDFLWDEVPVDLITGWYLEIEDFDGNFIDSAQVVFDDGIMTDFAWEFCLPEGCYTAEVFYPFPLGDWFDLLDINLVGVGDQNVTYTGGSDYMQFSLGDADCDIEPFTEPLAALSAWPNPAAAGAGVTVEISTDNATLLTLRDLHGREIDRISHPNPREFIATAELPSGIYLLELQTPNGRETLRLVVQR